MNDDKIENIFDIICTDEFKDVRNKLLLFLDENKFDTKLALLAMINICGSTLATSENVEGNLESVLNFLESCFYMTKDIIKSKQNLQ